MFTLSDGFVGPSHFVPIQAPQPLSQTMLVAREWQSNVFDPIEPAQAPHQTTQNSDTVEDAVAQGGSGTNPKKRKTTAEVDLSIPDDPRIAVVTSVKRAGKVRGVVSHGAILHLTDYELLLFILGCKLCVGEMDGPGNIHVCGIGMGDTPTDPEDEFVVWFDEVMSNLLRITIEFKEPPQLHEDLQTVIRSKNGRYSALTAYFLGLINCCKETIISGINIRDIFVRRFGVGRKTCKRTQQKLLVALIMIKQGAIVRFARLARVFHSMDNTSRTVAGKYTNAGIQSAVIIRFNRRQFADAMSTLKPKEDAEATQDMDPGLIEVVKKYHPNYNRFTKKDLLREIMLDRTRNMGKGDDSGVHVTPILYGEDQEDHRYCMVVTDPFKEPQT